MPGQGRTWKIGELAHETGLTVRALHHYDRLGLLRVASRTEGGHRTYTRDDVRRLHRIVALRSLGMSLEEVGALLDGEPDPVGLLRRQVEAVEERIRVAVALRARLLDVLDDLGRNAEPTTEQLLQLIEETVAMNEPLTPEQFAELNRERERLMAQLSAAELAELQRKREDAWQALPGEEQERLTHRRRAMAPPDGEA
jgi:DNA-binding transcriptional MerR regulator